MKPRPVPLASFLLLAGAALAPASDDAPPRRLHLELGLAGGTRVLGLADEAPLELATAFGEIELSLAPGDRIEPNDDRETVTLRTRNGDVIRGVVLGPGLLVRPYGADGARKVPGDGIRALVVRDPFRVAGSGDAVWEVAFENAAGWSPAVRGGAVEVSDVVPLTVHSAGGGDWSGVRLSRPLRGRADFDLEADIAWDDRGAGRRAMQNLVVSVADEHGGAIAAVGHLDAWVGETGRRYSQVPGVKRTKRSGRGTQPLRGRATVGIRRVGDRVTVLWDGDSVHAGRSDAPADRVEVRFEHYPFRRGGLESEPGAVTLRRLELR